MSMQLTQLRAGAGFRPSSSGYPLQAERTEEHNRPHVRTRKPGPLRPFRGSMQLATGGDIENLTQLNSGRRR